MERKEDAEDGLVPLSVVVTAAEVLVGGRALSVVVIPIELPAGVRRFVVVVDAALASICSTAVCVVVIERPELVEEEEPLELVEEEALELVENDGGASLSSVVVIEMKPVAIGCAPLSVFVIEINPDLVSPTSPISPLDREELDAEAVNVIVTLTTEVTVLLGRGVVIVGVAAVLVDPAPDPHIFQHRQLPAILSNPICPKSAYPGYTIGADALPVQFEPVYRKQTWPSDGPAEDMLPLKPGWSWGAGEHQSFGLRPWAQLGCVCYLPHSPAMLQRSCCSPCQFASVVRKRQT